MVLEITLKLLACFVIYHGAFAQSNPCTEFDSLNTEIRDGNISRHEALAKLRDLIPLIRDYYYQSGSGRVNPPEAGGGWIFPLGGYDASSIGGVGGSGYKPQGYDYFDGNKHGGHPAHDIFIYDRNQDDLDDYTGKPVNVLSVTNGIVVACEPGWEAGSDLRGGKYIYIYDPAAEGLFYYAHNSRIFVTPGDIVKAGDVIAECGRTGHNAYKKRSPTHLHLMYLRIDDGYPRPQDIYENLLSAKTML